MLWPRVHSEESALVASRLVVEVGTREQHVKCRGERWGSAQQEGSAGAVAPRRVSANCDGAVVSGVAEERPFLLLQNLRTVSPAAWAVFSNGRGCEDGRGEGRGSLLQFWAVFRDAQAGGVRSSLILLHKQTALTTNCSRWICIHSSIYSFIYFVQRQGGKKAKSDNTQPNKKPVVSSLKVLNHVL